MLAARVVAQCPDGTPPPCPGQRVAALPAPDPNRIAILPFRIRAADTLLNEGIPELIATEFTGEHGPRAVHMGTVLRAWRRAGGGVGRPLEPAEMRQLAREVDAGLVVDGSVVGLGSRITISASVVAVTGGAVRRVASVSGPADSLEVLIGRLTAGLLAAVGAGRGDGATAPLTSSPEAMRAYLEGLALYRRGHWDEAQGPLERAFGLDSSFARAVFMRYIVSTWTDVNRDWGRMVWARRDRLSTADRVLLEAFLGSGFPGPRTPHSDLADRRRAVRIVPESPEAAYLLGDYLFHHGAANDIADHLVQARDEFARGLALDTQFAIAGHLIETGLILGDTALLRRVWPAYERLRGDAAALDGLFIAERTGDRAFAAALARRPVPRGSDARLIGLVETPLAAAAAGRILQRLDDEWSPTGWAGLERVRGWVLVRTGQPTALAALRREVQRPLSTFALDRWTVLSWLFGDGDSVAAAAAAERLGTLAAGDSLVRARAMCARALWQLRVGEVPQYDPAFLRNHELRGCEATLDLLRAEQAGTPDLEARLVQFDSLVHVLVSQCSFCLEGLENLVLSRLWEARGDLARALTAVRLRAYGFNLNGSVDAATAARTEGRLAELLGDHAAAIRAYRRYLDLRREAEPSLVPQRDSVAAALARLERT